GAVGTGDRDAVAAVDLQRHRSQVEPATAHLDVAQHRDHPTGRAGRRDVHPQLPLAARLLDHLEPFELAVGLPCLRGDLLARGDPVVADELVALGAVAARRAHALGRPLPLHPRAAGQLLAASGVLLVPLPLAGTFALAL